MSGMLDVVDSSDKPADYNGKVFIAKVMATVDPKECHRIKIMIPDLIEGDVAALPWAIPDCIPGGIGPTETRQWIPEVGSLVYVTLQNGDVHFPMYGGGVPTFESVKGVLAVNYPHRVGFQINSFTEKDSGEDRNIKFESKDDPTPYPEKGHHWYIDRSTNETEYHHPQGTKYRIDPNGKVTIIIENSGSAPPADLLIDVTKGKANIHVKGTTEIHSEGDAYVHTNGNLLVESGGTMDLRAGGDMTLTAPNIHLN